jgi:hypothetical protein
MKISFWYIPRELQWKKERMKKKRKEAKKHDGVSFLQTKLPMDLNPPVNPCIIFNL